MTRLAKRLLKDVVSQVPYLRESYFQWEFLRTAPSFKGIYASFPEAMAQAPPQILTGYNHRQIARLRESDLEELNPADYPVLFWLGPLLPQARAIFDLGGNLGVAYYAYDRYLAFPGHLRWTVCEVPAIAAAGRELAQRKGVERLHFTDRREAAGKVDIYFTCGALQYIEEPLAAILRELPRLPRHLLVNRVPLCDSPSFITLQNNGSWTAPYKVENRDAFVQSFVSLGYELVDSWKINRTLRVLMSPPHRAENYHGMYFRLFSDRDDCRPA